MQNQNKTFILTSLLPLLFLIFTPYVLQLLVDFTVAGDRVALSVVAPVSGLMNIQANEIYYNNSYYHSTGLL